MEWDGTGWDGMDEMPVSEEEMSMDIMTYSANTRTQDTRFTPYDTSRPSFLFPTTSYPLAYPNSRPATASDHIRQQLIRVRLLGVIIDSVV